MNIAVIATVAFFIFHPLPPKPFPTPPQQRPPLCSCDLPEGTVCVMSRHTCARPTPPVTLVCGPGTPAGSSCNWPGEAFVVNLADRKGNTIRQAAIIEGPLLVPAPADAMRLLWHVAISEAWTTCASDFQLSFHGEIIADGWCAP